MANDWADDRGETDHTHQRGVDLQDETAANRACHRGEAKVSLGLLASLKAVYEQRRHTSITEPVTSKPPSSPLSQSVEHRGPLSLPLSQHYETNSATYQAGRDTWAADSDDDDPLVYERGQLQCE
jgi:hypothetical protein